MSSSSPTTLDAHSPAARYLGLAADLVDRLRTTEGANILAAARIIADALVAQRTIHIFGTGHSHMLAEELYYRAGGLVNVKPLLFDGLMLHTSALLSTSLERLPGLAEALLRDHPIAPDDVLIVASNSGSNAVTSEIVQLAMANGTTTVAPSAMRPWTSLASAAGCLRPLLWWEQQFSTP